MNRSFAISVLAACALCCGNLRAANATTTTLVAAPTTASLGQAVTLTATVSNSGATPAPTGKVTFFNGAAVLGAAPLVSGSTLTATIDSYLLPSSAQPSGTHKLRAVYQGDADNSISVSGAVSVRINASPGNGFAVAAGSPPAVTAPVSIAAGDLNNDGEPDLVVANSTEVLAVTGNGDGSFTPKPALSIGTCVFMALADYEGDNRADLVCASGNTVAVYRGDGAGAFSTTPLTQATLPSLPPVGMSTPGAPSATGIVVSDFNGDGRPDVAVIAVTLYSGLPPGDVVAIYTVQQKSDGTMDTPVVINPFGNPLPLFFTSSIAAGDFDNDGFTDLVIARIDGRIYVLTGVGDGTFDSPVDGANPSAVMPYAMAPVVADFNGDGNADIAVVDATGNILMGLGAGDATFTWSSSQGTGSTDVRGLAAGDFNGDGKPDLVAAVFDQNQTKVFLNSGSGAFNPPVAVTTANGPEGVVVADFSSDSRADFAAIAHSGNQVSIRLGTGPTITSLSPSGTIAGAPAFTLTINGANFASGDTVSWLPGGSVTPQNLTPVTFVSSNVLTVQVPANLVAANGTATVAVADPSVTGLVSNDATFTIGSGPSITALSPTSVAAGGAGFTLTITGTNFVTGDKVVWQLGAGTPTELSNTTVTGPTSLTVPVPAALLASTGTVSVSVKDPTGVTSAPATFNIAQPPTLTSLSVSTAVAGGPAFSLSISGAGLVTDDKVRWTPSGGGAATDISGVTVGSGGTVLTVQIPASVLAAVDANAQISVVDPGGAVSNALPLSVVGPIITTIDPLSRGTGAGAFELTVNGSNFIAGGASKVRFTPVTGVPVDLTPSTSTTTQLKVTVDEAYVGTAPGNATVAVVNGTGATSNTVNFPIARPAISAITPPGATIGGNADLSITVNGSNFGPNAKVLFCFSSCGTPTQLTTTVTSSGVLTASIPVTSIGTVGTATITVTNTPSNPTDPNTLSEAVSFRISTLTLSSLSPGFALAGGPAFNLIVSGQNFTDGAKLLWGSLPALTPTGAVSTSQFTVTVPRDYIASQGDVGVQVQSVSGSVSNSLTFSVGQLEMTTISPSLLVAGTPGAVLTITGRYFDDKTQVLWNGSSDQITTTFISSTTLTASIPASLLTQAGTVQLTVRTTSANVTSAPKSVIIEGPSILSVNPSNATVGAPSFALQVTGTNFLNGSKVKWYSGGGTATDLQTTYVSPNGLMALVPTALLANQGTALVVVQNPGDGGAISNGMPFSVGLAPTIATDGTGLSPATATAGGPAFQLTVRGSNFVAGSTVVWTAGGTSTRLATSLNQSAELLALVTADLIAAAGTAVITVENPGKIASNPLPFTVGAGQAPVLATLTPPSAAVGSAAFALSVGGTGFVPGTQVYWNLSATPLTTIYRDSTLVTALVPASSLSTVSTAFITAKNPGSAHSNPLNFEVTSSAPTISVLSQNSVPAGSGALTLSITGSGFNTASVVQWNAGAGAKPLATSYSSPTVLVALVPASMLTTGGVAFISVLNSGDVGSNSVPFAIQAQPTIAGSGLNPSSAVAGGTAFQLLVTGSNFASGAEVMWNAGASALPLSTFFINTGQLLALVPDTHIAAAGGVYVTVRNPGDLYSNTVPFTIASAPALPPTVASGGLAPSSATAGSAAFMLTVSGTNFAPTSMVNWHTGSGSPQALTTTFVNSTQLTALVPAANIAAPGTAYINVSTPNSGSSSLVAFTVYAPAPPAINTTGGLTPDHATAGTAAFQMGVTGSNFAGGAIVQWNSGTGATALATVWVSASQLTALVPAGAIAAAGSAFVSVKNPDGVVSNLVPFTIGVTPQPDITSLNPNTATAGGPAFQLTVTGSNFTSGSTVKWSNGGTPQPLTTAYVSPSQLTAAVPAGLISAAGTVFVSVTTPEGAGSGLAVLTISEPAAPPVPTITAGGLTPSSATVGTPGLLVLVAGTNFVPSSKVQWTSANGGKQQLDTVYLGASALSAVVPESLLMSVGAAFISVETPGAGSSGMVIFSINAAAQPAINTTAGLNPDHATAGDAAFNLGVTGSNFVNGSVVQWNTGSGAQTLATIFVSTTQLTALVPAAQIANAGNAFVNVLNPSGGVSNLVSFRIDAASVPAQPIISAGGLSPSTVVAGTAGFQLTVTGSSFVSGSAVQWSTGGTPQALQTYYSSPTQLSAMVPATLIATPGTAFVSVLNPGSVGSNLATFTITSPTAPPAPAITTPGGMTPSTATAGGLAVQLHITGTNFVAPSGSSTGSVVQWNGGSGAVSLTTAFVSSTELMALAPASMLANVGSAFVTVLNPGGLVSNSVTFSITAAAPPPTPTITDPGGLTPESIVAGSAAYQLAVTGTNFPSGSVVQWTASGTPQSLPTNYVSATQLVASVSAPLVADPGVVFISVKTPAGQVSNLVSYHIVSAAAPAIAVNGISPPSAATGSSGASLTITGSNFVTASKVLWNSGSGPQTLETGYISPTQLYASVPGTLLAVPATAMISVQNPDGATSNSVLFNVTGIVVLTPALTSISPSAAAAGSPALTLTLNGQNFVAGTNNTNGSVVQWNGATLPTTFVSASQLTALVDASQFESIGSSYVTVLNPGNATSSGLKFRVVGPTLTGMSPNTVTAGAAAFTLTLNGSEFVPGSVVVWSGTNLATTVSSTTLLTASVPANLVAAAGSAFVMVVNPGGASTKPQIFTISSPGAPVMSGLSPPSAIAGGPAFLLTVIGSGFAPGAVVNWNGTPLGTGYVSSTQLTALVDASLISTAGTANIAVEVPGAPMSASLRFNVNGPAITTLNPTTISAGDPAFMLTVTGSNFVPGSTVVWNASRLPTAYVGSTQIMANVPADAIKTQASVSLTVENPGGAVSAPMTFTVGPPSLRITTTALPDGVVGTFYSQVLGATGGDLPHTWSITSGNLPDGLSLDAASGTISGTPTGAANVSLGVTVVDAKGRVASRTLQLRITLALTITTVSPLPAGLAGVTYSVVLSAIGGTPPYLWSSAGVLPHGLLLNVATGEISGTPTSPGAYNFTITVTDSRQQQTASKSFNAIVSVPSFTIGGFSTMSAPAQQVPLSVTIASPYATELNGSLTLSFTSSVGDDDPSIQFSTGGRVANFVIPAGATQAVFGQNQQLLVSTGTVAGTITVKAAIKVGSSDITPAFAPQATTTIPKLAPVITSATLKRAEGGVVVSFAGYATNKEVTQANIQFNAAPGAALSAPPATVPLASTISAWYQSAAAAAYGSQFVVSIPFGIQGSISAIGSVTVAVSNTLGNSAPVTANLQ